MISDFAVGAPYEENGAVYIYHGDASKEGFKKEYVQVMISFSSLPIISEVLKILNDVMKREAKY